MTAILTVLHSTKKTQRDEFPFSISQYPLLLFHELEILFFSVWKVLLKPNCSILSFFFFFGFTQCIFYELTSLDHSAVSSYDKLASPCLVMLTRKFDLFFFSHLLFSSQVLDWIPTALKLDVNNFDLKNETESGFFLSYLMESCIYLPKQSWPVLVVLRCISILFCFTNSLLRGGSENNQI